MRRDPTCPGLIVTGTGTGVGKTTLARGLAGALRGAGVRVAALKPFETGVLVNPDDAIALAEACGRPELAHAPELYRARPALAPFAIELLGGRACDPAAVADAVRSAGSGSDVVLVEGVGGIAVPLTRSLLFADFAAMLGWPVLIVARDELGALSHVLAALEIARARKLDVELLVLSSVQWPPDEASSTNARVLREMADVPVATYRSGAPHDDESAVAAEAILRRLAIGQQPGGDRPLAALPSEGD
jgi:dethiobiotin synthetase